MYEHLKDLCVVEGASFIAAPSCGLYLAQLGAQVIRFDQIGGGFDFRRWPRTSSGASLYWEGLNKGKKSIAIDLNRREGRELAVRLATAPGRNRGIFLTNYPEGGFLSYENLVALRPDLIAVRIMGWADGAAALDYTINCAVGVPDMTGPLDHDGPVNHVLPAWDLFTGAYAAFALLAAERSRKETGRGEEVRVPLSDIAISSLGNLGQIGEVMTGQRDRAKNGNDLFGAFGRDFLTRDGVRVMIVAITPRQWSGLVRALGIEQGVASEEERVGVSFTKDEGLRFTHRDTLNRLVATAVEKRDYASLESSFRENGVCWGPYRTLMNALRDDARLVADNPVFSSIDHPSGHRYPAPGSAATMTGHDRQDARPAPRLGEHTEEILSDLLGCSAGEVAALHDRGLVAGAKAD